MKVDNAGITITLSNEEAKHLLNVLCWFAGIHHAGHGFGPLTKMIGSAVGGDLHVPATCPALL
jgi:hypothetical protein